jgi:hypothetical protein
MEELAKRCDVYMLWDSLCNSLPWYYTIGDVAEEFAKMYEVDVEEVKEYFI